MCVCLCVCRLVFCPSWLAMRCGGLCLGLGCTLAPPLLAGVLGRVKEGPYQDRPPLCPFRL